MSAQARFLILTTLLLASFAGSPLFAASGVIDRIEPPFWWTGFEDSRLQIMVYGDNISAYEPSVDHPGISLEEVIRVESPNYLFIYLDLSKEAQAGDFEIIFTRKNSVLIHRYALRKKNTDPYHARGFDGSDAIYLITPDRFANGNPANDAVEGLVEQPNRANKDGRHGGDIEGITEHLDYIANMGFTAIWLNPLLENDMPDFSYHGYAATDFYRVDPRYGTNEQYRELVQSARAMGIDTIMDMIVNHCGEEHWWMDDLPTADWINLNENPRVTSHQHAASIDPHASEYDRRAFSDGWFVVRGMPDLNQRNPLLADYLVQNALWWIEYLGLAGIRMDTYPYPDKDYMAKWTQRVMREYPDFNIVGEEWSSNPVVVSYWQKGQSNNDGYVSDLPSLMDFPIQESLWLALTTEDGESMYDNSPGGLMKLYRMLANDILYPDPNALVIFPDNHDMDRIFTQVGHDEDLLRIALTYILTMRGIPQIYYGTEILMANGDDKSHGTIRSDFPGGWAADEKNAFTGAGLSENEKETQEFVRSLLNWRQDKSVIHNGKTMQFSPQDATYVYFRYDDNDAVMVAINKNDAPFELSLDRFEERLDGFTSAQEVISGKQLKLESTLTLPPRTALILDLQP